MARKPSLRIGELSERTGVPRHTIRFYERTGVLPEPARTRSGYRSYEPEAVERLEFIRKGQALGLKLSDIADVLEISEGGREPCGHVRGLIEDRLQEAEARLRELENLRDTLRATLRGFDAVESGRGCRCGVIEGMPLADHERTRVHDPERRGQSPMRARDLANESLPELRPRSRRARRPPCRT